MMKLRTIFLIFVTILKIQFILMSCKEKQEFSEGEAITIKDSVDISLALEKQELTLGFLSKSNKTFFYNKGDFYLSNVKSGYLSKISSDGKVVWENKLAEPDMFSENHIQIPVVPHRYKLIDDQILVFFNSDKGQEIGVISKNGELLNTTIFQYDPPLPGQDFVVLEGEKMLTTWYNLEGGKKSGKILINDLKTKEIQEVFSTSIDGNMTGSFLLVRKKDLVYAFFLERSLVLVFDDKGKMIEEQTLGFQFRDSSEETKLRSVPVSVSVAENHFYIHYIPTKRDSFNTGVGGKLLKLDAQFSKVAELDLDAGVLQFDEGGNCFEIRSYYGKEYLIVKPLQNCILKSSG